MGGLGDIGGFSLNYHKQVHAGEGGLMVTGDDELALRMQLIRNHGENVTEAWGVKDIANTIGSNYRFTELQAAIAAEQFKKLKGILAHRAELAKTLDGRLRALPGLKIRSSRKAARTATTCTRCASTRRPWACRATSSCAR